MEKSPDAFRTISEVAEWLDVPTHVLRFWESRFAQIKPVKRAGGRRYYRPNDMRLIGGIKVLLHDDGLTIRGVQKMLREKGIRHVSSFSPLLPGEVASDAAVPEEVVDLTPAEPVGEPVPARPARVTSRALPTAPPTETAQMDMFAAPADLPQDPADDDVPLPSESGIAARLWQVDRDRLAAHPELIDDIARRLVAARAARGG